MNTLLRLDCSLRTEGSHTRQLADYFCDLWRDEQPAGQVIRRCFAKAPVPHLTQNDVEYFHSQDNTIKAPVNLSDKLIEELILADQLLIASPLYNYNLSSALKAYFDHVIRRGTTFDVINGKYTGLLSGKRATVITSRSSYASNDARDDFQTDYLKAILGFIGIHDVSFVSLQGMGEGTRDQEGAMQIGKGQVAALFRSSGDHIWKGLFRTLIKTKFLFLGTIRRRRSWRVMQKLIQKYVQKMCSC